MSATVAVPLWVVALVILAAFAFALILWSVKRRKRPHLRIPEDSRLESLVYSVAGLTQGTVVEGNRIELLQNGVFWERVFAELTNARRTINFETFLAHEGELTRRLTEVLCEKQQGGVAVRMLLDGSGARKFGKAELRRLRAAGVDVRFYHRYALRNLGIINNRDHRKLIVIDGRLGFIGGHCLADTWLGDAEDKQHFRDISARVEGPVVAQLQSTFAENWIEETGEVVASDAFFPTPERAGDTRAHAVWLSPSSSPSSLKVLHYMLIHAAQKSITIQNPYFLPDPDARDALVAAVQRGVEVRIMIPATDATDQPIVQHASHHHYGTLLKGGVKLYDYQRTLLHQKVITIDGLWAAIGSTNFDDRSFEVNDEVSLIVYDERIARQLEETFTADLRHAIAIDLGGWKKRPIHHKLLDFTAFLVNEQL